MTHLRVTIGAIMLIAGVTTVALAAIRSRSPAWAAAMFSITFFAMICSLLGIALGRGSRRVYWSGFALLGWSYLFLMYVPWLGTNIGQFLLAPELFEYLEDVLHGGAPPMTVGLRSVPVEILGAAGTGGGFATFIFSVAELSEFERLGLAIEALIWAFVGGWVAYYFACGREPRPASNPTASSGAAPQSPQRSE
jgi:hypothetical protein